MFCGTLETSIGSACEACKAKRVLLWSSVVAEVTMPVVDEMPYRRRIASSRLMAVVLREALYTTNSSVMFRSAGSLQQVASSRKRKSRMSKFEVEMRERAPALAWVQGKASGSEC